MIRSIDTELAKVDFQPERRAEQRFPLQLPLLVKSFEAQPREESTTTRDISARGVFFYLDSALPMGTQLELLLTLPAEITLTENIRVRCKSKVVRVVEPGLAGKTGIAAIIEKYDFTHGS